MNLAFCDTFHASSISQVSHLALKLWRHAGNRDILRQLSDAADKLLQQPEMMPTLDLKN